jgi:Flp pilus assembly protein TadD
VDPKDGAACGNLEALLRTEGRIAEAEVYRKQGLEVRKDDPYFNAFLAREGLENLDFKEAASRIKRAIRLLPQEPEFHLLQARVFLAEGDAKAAIRSLERAQRWASPEEQARYASKIALLQGRKP